jgi:hypothetical protein
LAPLVEQIAIEPSAGDEGQSRVWLVATLTIE